MRFSNRTTLNPPSRNLNQNSNSNSNSNSNITTIDGYDFNRARSSESTEDALVGNAKPKAIAIAIAIAIGLATQSSTTDTATGSGSGSGSSNASSAEDRGVPVSPKKLPMTPPRDLGSPYGYSHGHGPSVHSEAEACAYDYSDCTRMQNHNHNHTLLPPSAVRQRQPFWGDDHSPSNGDINGFHLQCNSNLHNNPPSWRHRGGEEDVGFLHHAHSHFQNDSSVFRSSSFEPNPMGGMSLSREHDSYYSIQRSFAFEDEDGDGDE